MNSITSNVAASEMCNSHLGVTTGLLLVDPGARIGNPFRRMSCAVINSGRELKLTEQRCQGNEGGQFHAVK